MHRLGQCLTVAAQIVIGAVTALREKKKKGLG